MSESEWRERIRGALEELIPEPETLDVAVDRVIKAIGPFERVAEEELERFRSTFAELAK